jgi:hypothetical protein
MGGDKKEILTQLSKALAGIQDERIREVLLAVLNVIEQDAETIRQLREENQRLRDEVSRLKGEQGKPKIRPEKPKDESQESTGSQKENRDISSEKERRKDKGRSGSSRKRKKKNRINIDHTEIRKVDKTLLPPDAEFKGYAESTVQDLIIKPDNVLFRKEVYYSPSEGKTYTAEVPVGYQGEYGPHIKTTALILKNVCNMSEPKILELFHNCNIIISAGTVSNMLIKDKEAFHEEKQQLYRAGLGATEYQQIDDTSARVNGQNYYMQVLGNPYYTAYFTAERKDRLTVLQILSNGEPDGGQGLRYLINDEAFQLLQQMRIGKKITAGLRELKSDRQLSKEEIEELLSARLPLLNPIAKTRILEATAIAWYHQAEGYPVIQTLLCDDAPQYKLLTEYLALCWVHDGRHYKKLSPVVPYNVRILEEFIDRYWQYYRKLLAYKEAPSETLAASVSAEFDKLFSTETGYALLDERISKTKAKKGNLLLVLKFPQIPLHNNDSELAARQQTRRRDVSLHTMVPEGTKANDTFLSIVQTCKKLGINCYEYFLDRIQRTFAIPPLAVLIADSASPQ